MQPVTTIDISIIILPSILLGVLFGYFVGEMTRLSMTNRAILSIVLSIIGGTFISFLLSSILTISLLTIFLSITAALGGIILGIWYNWTPPSKTIAASHIIYEYDEEEEFEREVDRALGRE